VLPPFENPRAAFGILLEGLRRGQETGEIASTPDAAVDPAQRSVGVLDYGLEPRGDAE
jgi:hypothetical protein